MSQNTPDPRPLRETIEQELLELGLNEIHGRETPPDFTAAIRAKAQERQSTVSMNDVEDDVELSLLTRQEPQRGVWAMRAASLLAAFSIGAVLSYAVFGGAKDQPIGNTTVAAAHSTPLTEVERTALDTSDKILGLEGSSLHKKENVVVLDRGACLLRTGATKLLAAVAYFENVQGVVMVMLGSPDSDSSVSSMANELLMRNAITLPESDVLKNYENWSQTPRLSVCVIRGSVSMKLTDGPATQLHEDSSEWGLVVPFGEDLDFVPPFSRDAIAQRLFVAFDTNQDGKIDAAEASQDPILTAEFLHLDANMDNSLTLDELANSIQPPHRGHPQPNSQGNNDPNDGIRPEGRPRRNGPPPRRGGKDDYPEGDDRGPPPPRRDGPPPRRDDHDGKPPYGDDGDFPPPPPHDRDECGPINFPIE